MTERKNQADQSRGYHLKIVRGPLASGYSDAGASLTKRSMKAFIAASLSAVEDIDFNNATMRQRGRMLYMASPIATAAINTNRTKVVGSGLYMRCAVDRDVLRMTETAAAEWSKRTQAEFRLWAENKLMCDSLGMNNFYELQKLALKSALMSGDLFGLIRHEDATSALPYGLRIHLIEADRISTPIRHRGGRLKTEGETADGNKIHDGVEVNTAGRVIAYYICSHYPNSHVDLDNSSWTRIEAVGRETGLPNMLHVMDPERPEQYRGVTYLAPVIETLLQSRRYTESELTAAIVQSYLTAWITTETDPTEFPFSATGDDLDALDDIPLSPKNIEGDTAEKLPVSLRTRADEVEMGPGTVNVLKPGEKVVLGNPNIPTAGFESFMKTIIKLSGAALEQPYDVLMKEFDSSYSAAKGALEEAWYVFLMLRKWFVSDFCQPIYEIWLAEAVARGRINAPGFFSDPLIRKAWCGAVWDGPAQTHLDPIKEARANETLVAHGWKTNAQITRESYGGDWYENMAALAAENGIAPQINQTSV